MSFYCSRLLGSMDDAVSGSSAAELQGLLRYKVWAEHHACICQFGRSQLLKLRIRCGMCTRMEPPRPDGCLNVRFFSKLRGTSWVLILLQQCKVSFASSRMLRTVNSTWLALGSAVEYNNIPTPRLPWQVACKWMHFIMSLAQDGRCSSAVNGALTCTMRTHQAERTEKGEKGGKSRVWARERARAREACVIRKQ